MDNRKFMIITDERSGSTNFLKMFKSCNIKTLADPLHRNNSIHYENKINVNKDNIVNIIDYTYKKLNIGCIKLCTVVINNDNLLKIIDYCGKNNIVIVVLNRNNIFERALSKCIALKINDYGIFNETINRDTFNIDEQIYENYIIDNISKVECIMNKINNNNYKYLFVTYEDIFLKKKAKNFFKYINLDIINKIEFDASLTMDYKTTKKNNLVNNLNNLRKIEKKYKHINFNKYCNIQY